MLKSFTFALTGLVASASFAMADESFFEKPYIEMDRTGHIELGTVRAAQDGTVEIYSYHNGELGQLLGTTDVHAGANLHVHINTLRPATDSIAVLRINGQVADTEEIEFR